MPADPDRISDLAPADLHPRDEACASTLCGHKRKDHLSWDGEPTECGHPDCHASADLRCQAFVEARTPDPCAHDLHPRDEACIHCAAPARLASPDPVIDCPREECPMPRPAVVDPTACTCRPLLRGVDVNPGCPSHGRQK